MHIHERYKVSHAIISFPPVSVGFDDVSSSFSLSSTQESLTSDDMDTEFGDKVCERYFQRVGTFFLVNVFIGSFFVRRRMSSA